MRHWCFGWVFILVALSSCSQDIIAPTTLPPVTSIQQYFWTKNSAPMPLADSNGGQITLTFHDSSGLLFVGNGNTSSLICTLSDDSIYAANFTSGSVIDLDPYSYFSRLDTEARRGGPPHTMIVWNNPKQPIVATDSGVFAYNTSSGVFESAGLTNVLDITALAGDSVRKILYAATTSGDIWYSTNWPTLTPAWTLLQHSGLPPGPITQLIQSNTMLYATVDGASGIYASPDGSSWTQIDYLLDKQVTVIGSVVAKGSSYLMAATSDGFIGAFPLNGSKPQNPAQITGSGKVYCFGIGPTEVPFAGTDDGLYQWDTLRNSWSVYSPFASYKGVISFLSSSSYFYFIANGTTYYTNFPTPSSVASFAPIPNSSPIKLGLTDHLCMLTINGFDFMPSQVGGIWQPVSGLDFSNYPYVPGGLVLLRANPDTGKFWRAGTLVTKLNEQSYAIEARVMKRLNALEINGHSYPDILMVRYAHENSGGTPEQTVIPYWMVYYQKGVGPIMFEKITNSGVIERRAVASP
jgi:hypothetical protein